MLSKAVVGCLLLLALLFVHESSGVPAKCSPALERIKRALAINSRTKRTIYVPPKTHWQCKWALNIPLETVARYAAKIQLSIPIDINFPAWLFDEYGYDKIKGDYYDYHHHDGYDRNDYYNDIEHHDDRDLPILHKRSVGDDGDGLSVQKRSIDDENVYTEDVYSRATQRERIYLYEHMEGLFDKLGMSGVDCLQRTICETAEDPMDEGLIGDWMNLVLTPSSAVKSPNSSLPSLLPYLQAEGVGGRGRRCDLHYETCPVSMFRLLPLVTETLFGGF